MKELKLVENKIYEMRGLQVMLDFDLAEMYGIETKRLKEAVRRNIERFPDDFMFELTREEYHFLRTQIASLEIGRGKYSKYQPFAFTEQGVAMLSSVLSSKKAIEINIGIMRAFVVIRKCIAQTSPKNIEERIKSLEEVNEELLRDMNDLSEDTRKSLDEMFDAFAQLANEINLNKTKPPRNPVGFVIEK